MTMITREQVVAEARSWLGTPYRHQGRTKGLSVDCAGLVIGVCRALGLEAEDMEGYSSRPDGTLKAILYRQTEPVPIGGQQAGDVVLFHWNNEPVHVGLLTGPAAVIHSFATNRRVCEHAIDAQWRRKIVAYRKLRGVE
jgi:NlpC/P60 family putative phage cell wall peptidase